MYQRSKLQTTETADEPELIRRAQRGDQGAFTTLYRRTFSVVHSRVRYAIPAPDVEDVIQEVYMAVANSLANYNQDSQFSTWIRTLANRRIADYYRRRRNQQVLQEVELEEAMQPGAESPAKMIAERMLVQEALLSLPEQYREIIQLRFVENLPFKEIAVLQDASLEATKSRFRRAIAALREVLDDSNE